MTIADQQYDALGIRLLEEGWMAPTRGTWKDGTPAYAKKLFGQSFRFDLSKEFPILTKKKVMFEKLVREMLWIYRGDNDVTNLQKEGVHIWDEWMIHEEGPWKNTIGAAYGYQIAKFDQLNKLIQGIKKDPQSRRHIITLWNVEDLPEMALQPCAFQTIWDVTDGRLNCQLVQRSGDYFLGVPFNFTQYAVLVHIVAHFTGLKPGILYHTITNVHIYDRHIPLLQQQLDREAFEAPEIWLNPGVQSFEDLAYEDFRLRGYQSHPFIRAEVAV